MSTLKFKEFVPPGDFVPDIEAGYEPTVTPTTYQLQVVDGRAWMVDEFGNSFAVISDG